MEPKTGNLDSANDIKNGIRDISKSALDGTFFSRNASSSALPLAPSPDAEVYKTHQKRGMAIIFNHKKFTNGCSTRVGTDKDRDDLKGVLKELKFDVRSYDDQTYEEIIEILNVVSKMDHSDSECLVIAIMTHGENGYLYAKDRAFVTKKIWTRFSPLHCPSLSGKPKLFFIQACRGDKTDPGSKVSYDEPDSLNSKDLVYSIPLMADILIMYATVEEYYAWRDPKNGSYFIQSLVRQLRKHHTAKDLLSILTCVNREVAIGFTSTEPHYPEFNKKKEMCSIVSMLTRMYHFTAKTTATNSLNGKSE